MSITEAKTEKLPFGKPPYKGKPLAWFLRTDKGVLFLSHVYTTYKIYGRFAEALHCLMQDNDTQEALKRARYSS